MRFCFVLALVILLSCNDNSVPKDVLSKEKMEAVLWDVMRADEMVSQYSITDSSFKDVSKNAGLYQKIFQIHNITKTTFQKSLQYYQQHPAQLQPVIDSLKAFSERKTLAPVSIQ
jgi:hypothetical protein